MMGRRTETLTVTEGGGESVMVDVAFGVVGTCFCAFQIKANILF